MPEEKGHRSPKKNKPHDAVFKAFFSDVKIARNYLLHYSPPVVYEQIDFSFFQKIDTTFVSGRFGISFSDVLYETRLTNGMTARVIFLFEHKSYVPSRPIHLQLLDYMLQIWEDDIKNERPLSVIVPIVVYHGGKGWEQKPFFAYFMELPEDWAAFIPNFHYLLTDLSQLPAWAIEGKKESEYLVNLLLALKFSRYGRRMKKNREKILTFGDSFYLNDRESILFQVLTVYLIKLTNMSSVEYKELKKGLPKPPQQVIDFIHEVFGDEIPRFIREELEEEAHNKGWKKGEEKGFASGMEIGMEKGMEIGMEKGMEIGMEKGTEKGIEIGRLEQTETRNRAFTLKTIEKFPDWSDAEVAEFVEVPEGYVRQLRGGSAI